MLITPWYVLLNFKFKYSLNIFIHLAYYMHVYFVIKQQPVYVITADGIPIVTFTINFFRHILALNSLPWDDSVQKCEFDVVIG